MPTLDLQDATLGQVAIRVHDVGRATAFYRDQLGLPLMFEFTGLAFFRCGDVRLMLSRAEKPEFDHPGSILYYRVPDVEATFAELTSRGVEFVDTPHVVHRTPTSELWMVFFTDSEGNHAALMGEKPVSD
ncbi:MAG: VOC family protein [Gemmatimonadales bacterium]